MKKARLKILKTWQKDLKRTRTKNTKEGVGMYAYIMYRRHGHLLYVYIYIAYTIYIYRLYLKDSLKICPRCKPLLCPGCHRGKEAATPRGAQSASVNYSKGFGEVTK